MTNKDQILKNNQPLAHPCCSMKETEERLKSLTKENFNLKLRIYFLEMRSIVSSNSVPRTDNKDYVELRMENESLKNNLDEMQNLIKQAAMAIDILEQNQKVKNMENDRKQKIQFNTIQNQDKTIATLKIVMNSLNNARNTQFDRDDVVIKMGTELNVLKSCNVILEQVKSFKENEIKMKGSKDLVLKKKVRGHIRKKLTNNPF